MRQEIKKRCAEVSVAHKMFAQLRSSGGWLHEMTEYWLFKCILGGKKSWQINEEKILKEYI